MQQFCRLSVIEIETAMRSTSEQIHSFSGRHHDGSHGAEMYKLLLETPHHPEGSGQPVDWDLLFGGPATSLSAAAQPRPVQAEAGQAGHVWPGNIIRGPLQDFAVECASALLCFCK